MKTHAIAPDYKGYRFPPEMISHAGWLYFRFSLSFRDVEELMTERGMVLTDETIQQWCLTFGQSVAVQKQEISGIWMRCFVSINGKTHSLWRAVDQDGNVLDIVVQSRRNVKSQLYPGPSLN